MTRILATALLVAAVTTVLLLQLERAQELWVWEVALVVLVVWLARGLPGGGVATERPLFEARPTGATRLPRSVSAAEMATVDALAGNLGRDQRIRPVIERIAAHRLHRHGFEIESSQAMAALGEEQWRWLTNREEVLRPGALDQLVSELERL
ncbi:MAG TPA: hypothetical protein VI980_04685 [Acidimicrobiia bacterium]|nr:hypothetical protein [Acidimicrobiia bacterium]